MFVTSDGSPYARLRRAIQARNIAIITATAAELPYVALQDALGILLVIEDKYEERFEAAAVRWAGRLALETPDLELAELAGALESLHALPGRARAAHAARARRAGPPPGAPRTVTGGGTSRARAAVPPGAGDGRARDRPNNRSSSRPRAGAPI